MDKYASIAALLLCLTCFSSCGSSGGCGGKGGWYGDRNLTEAIPVEQQQSEIEIVSVLCKP